MNTLTCCCLFTRGVIRREEKINQSEFKRFKQELLAKEKPLHKAFHKSVLNAV